MIANPQWWYALAALIDRTLVQFCLNVANTLDGTWRPHAD